MERVGRDRIWINEASHITDSQWRDIKLKDLKYQIPGKENKRILWNTLLCFFLVPICVVLVVLTRLSWMMIAYMNWQWAIILLLAIVAFVFGIKRIIQHIIRP